MKILNRNSNTTLFNNLNQRSDNDGIKHLTSEIKSIVALTKSWKCCSCHSENYNNKWTCSWCGHDRCGNCKQLEG